MAVAIDEYPACLGLPSIVFFGPGLGHPTRGKNKWKPTAAMAVCATCPLVASCLRRALLNDETEGVWGHTTVDHRRLIKSSHSNDSIRLMDDAALRLLAFSAKSTLRLVAGAFNDE